MIYTSNLVIGLERGLDDPAFLKRAADETGTGVELFLHTHDTAYLRNMEKAAQWLGDRPIAVMLAAFVATRFFSVNIILIILVCGVIGALDTLYLQKKEAEE